jgi:hypothetical protein
VEFPLQAILAPFRLAGLTMTLGWLSFGLVCGFIAFVWGNACLEIFEMKLDDERRERELREFYDRIQRRVL